MADSPAVRAARSRRHLAGDHSMCVPGRCPALGPVRRPADPPALATLGPGRVAEAVARYLTNFSFAEGDPRGVMTVIALRLAEAVDADGKPGTARELERVLSHLGEFPDEEPDQLDQIRLRYHVKMADLLLEAVRNAKSDDG